MTRRLLTAAAGTWARSPLSRPFITAFARRYGVDLSEADRPVGEYPTLSAFFSRGLRSGARPLDPDPCALVSPCDGALSTHGAIVDGALLQAKGIWYRLDDLLADRATARWFADGAYVTIYLAPCGYHGVHAPTAGRVVRAIHVGGALHPVHQRAAGSIDGLYRRNERVATILESEAGMVAVVQVGAFVVGSVELAYPGAPSLGRSARGVRVHDVVPAAPLSRGDPIGRFSIGSTVVVLTAKGLVEPSGVPRPGTIVRMGERLATVGGSG